MPAKAGAPLPALLTTQRFDPVPDLCIAVDIVSNRVLDWPIVAGAFLARELHHPEEQGFDPHSESWKGDARSKLQYGLP